MKKNIYIQTIIIAGIAILFGACKKDYGNLNGPSIEQYNNNATQAELNNLVSGTESGMRNSIAFYLDDIGTIGRESYHFANSEPRYVTDLLGANEATLNNSTFYITTPWASRYRVIKNCNVLINAANNSNLITVEQKNAYTGFAKTIKAYQLLMNLNLTDTNGIRVDVADADNPGPIVGYQEGLAAISSLLDEAETDLGNATVSFPLAGFNVFNDAAGLVKFNRALAARVNVYQQKWNDALIALNKSFFNLSGNFYIGVNHVFGTGLGDQLNPAFFPQNQPGEVRVAHPSYAEDIEANDDRIGKATLRSSAASLSDLSSNRDVWVYTSSTAPIPVIRNEELILIYAEANIQLNNLNEGVKALDVIREEHNLPKYSGAITQASLITEMLKQRRYSLYFEGHRWIDMRRYGRLHELPVDRPGDDVWTAFPLPVTEQ
jgi:hypothetical protein